MPPAVVCASNRSMAGIGVWQESEYGRTAPGRVNRSAELAGAGAGQCCDRRDNVGCGRHQTVGVADPQQAYHLAPGDETQFRVLCALIVQSVQDGTAGGAEEPSRDRSRTNCR